MHFASVAVVMPYFKNERTLLRSLASICAQGCPILREIVVVDDGGPMRATDVIGARSFNVPVTVLQSHGQGQSAATNRAIVHSRSELVVMTCADIILSPGFLAAHLGAHARGRGPQGVCGRIDYAPWVRMSPFMQYLAMPGPQFNFETVKDPNHVPPGLVYAPNFSARRQDLLDAKMFDELLVYGFQDIDLGIKLAQRGINLRYEAKAIALHDHPNSIAQFFERQKRVGRMLPRFISNHPSGAYSEKFVDQLRMAQPFLEHTTDMVEKIQVLEHKVQTTPGAFAALREPLFEVYSIVMMLGFLLGALETGDAIRKVIVFDDAIFEDMLATARSLQNVLSVPAPVAAKKVMPARDAPQASCI